MGKWTVTEDTLTYTFEYTNGFKRTIRKSQIAIATLPNGQTRYSSSQSPFIQLADTSVSITSYTAGLSTIGFTNNGGDDWNIEFKITPTSLQVPSGETVDSFDYNISFASGGTPSALESGNKTADYTYNASANGAGVYAISCTYNISDGSMFSLSHLIKVDASGNVLASIKKDGMSVISVSGLTLNYTASVQQVNATETVFIDAIDGSFNFTNIGNGASGSVAIPLGSIGVGIYTSLNATLWADLPSGYLSTPYQFGADNMVTIS